MDNWQMITHGKQLQEVAVWEKLETPLLATHFHVMILSLDPNRV